jgi:acetyl esterase/lipase
MFEQMKINRPLLMLPLLLGLLLPLSGCATVGLWAANLPSAFDSTTIKRDIAYGDQPAHKLDIYIPAGLAPLAGHEVVVYLYGGRWSSGDKSDYPFVASAFAGKNYLAVVPNYRQYPAVKFPDFAHDIARALAWVNQNIKSYGGNPQRVHVVGHSAGAHLGALVASDARYLRPYDLTPKQAMASFIGLAGPYAFEPEDADLIDMFGPPERYPLMRAPNFIDGTQPPMLLLHGRKDHLVVVDNLYALRDSIVRHGGHVETKLYDDTDHIWIVASLAWFGRSHAPVLHDITNFMATTETK